MGRKKTLTYLNQIIRSLGPDQYKVKLFKSILVSLNLAIDQYRKWVKGDKYYYKQAEKYLHYTQYLTQEFHFIRKGYYFSPNNTCEVNQANPLSYRGYALTVAPADTINLLNKTKEILQKNNVQHIVTFGFTIPGNIEGYEPLIWDHLTANAFDLWTPKNNHKEIQKLLEENNIKSMLIGDYYLHVSKYQLHGCVHTNKKVRSCLALANTNSNQLLAQTLYPM